jgi:hypothetical protein
MLRYPKKWIKYPLFIRSFLAGSPILILALSIDKLVTSDYDLATIIISGFGCIYGLIYMFKHAGKWPNYSEAIRIILLGVMFLFSTSILNSLIESQWNVQYIIDFFSLKKVGRWIFRVLASFGYVFIIWGTGKLISTFNKKIF